MAKNEERFVMIHQEGKGLALEGLRLLFVDKETGVTYLGWKSGYGAGLTPLLDAEGKPVITKL